MEWMRGGSPETRYTPRDATELRMERRDGWNRALDTEDRDGHVISGTGHCMYGRQWSQGYIRLESDIVRETVIAIL